LTVLLSQLSVQVARIRQRREQLQKELGRLVETVALCGHTPALVEAISRRERELDEIAQRLLSAEQDPSWLTATAGSRR
jgi:hypothetical protein